MKKDKEQTTKVKAPTKTKAEVVRISPPNLHTVILTLGGTAPLMQANFSGKTIQKMMAKMAAGQTAKKGAKKEARNFDEDFKHAMHISEDGWIGVPAAAIRNACIDVCRMVGFKMTHAKMSVFCLADGVDKDSGQPLIKLDAPEPERTELATRNATGVADIRIRPMWRTWKLVVRLQYDADQFTQSDIVNLVARAGLQIGIGEGRPYSKQSAGLGYGTFQILDCHATGAE
jgi:hypothetical protein